MERLINRAAEQIIKSKNTVVFTGAGISVESGIPPFRGADGLWSKYDPIILDINYFYKNTLTAWKVIKELFYDFFGKASPNEGHKVLAEWEKKGLLSAVLTQNIDNLHQEAGSKKVYEFHGTANSMICIECGAEYKSPLINLEILPPKCEKCKGVLKPNFIFFGEGIPEYASFKSFEAAEQCDVFIIIGTTGEVMPASTLPHTAKRHGAYIIEINPEISLFTNQLSDIHLKGKAGEILTKLNDEIIKLKA